MIDESRSPHGERGLKFALAWILERLYHSRSPHGERGLKCSSDTASTAYTGVAPRTGSVD